MSKHATVSAWRREEDGSYCAEINGFQLHVKWRPESPDQRRGFTWTATSPAGTKYRAEEIEEEIEVAMGHAEEVAGV
jgi:hypothetical protein